MHVAILHAHVIAAHVGPMYDGLMLSSRGGVLLVMARSGSSNIDSIKIHTLTAGDQGLSQFWCAAKVQVDVAGKDILPGVAFCNGFSARHLRNRTPMETRAAQQYTQRQTHKEPMHKAPCTKFQVTAV